MPAGIFLLQGRIQPAIPDALRLPRRVDPANRVEPDLVAAVIGRIFPGPAAKAGLPFFIAFGLRFPIGVFAVRLITSAAAHVRSYGAAATVIAGRLRPLLDRSNLPFFPACGSVHPLTALSSSASSLCGNSRRGPRPYRPPASIIVHSRLTGDPSMNTIRCPFPAHIQLRQAIPASAMTQVSCPVLSPHRPRAAFVFAPPVRLSSRKKGGRLIRGNR